MSPTISFADIPIDSDMQFVDVRSPGEFRSGHIPGAINIPLFDDAERAEIGTIYKQVDKKKALARGLEIAQPKVAEILARIKKLLPKEIIIHCWRGGMRSGEVCRLANEAGIPARLFVGGYKAYRRHIRAFIEQPRTILNLGGKTGSGKTAILLGLKQQGVQVIDLEGLAQHKGSVFGHINEPLQPTTEQFENNLYEELRPMDPTQPLLLENESYTIGSVHLPQPLLKQMRAAPLIVVEVPMQARISRLVKEYADTNREELIQAAQRIEKKLTRAKLLEVIALLEEDDFPHACEILLGYYDKYYNRGMDKRQNQSIHFLGLSGTDMDRDIALVREKIEELC